MANLRLWADAGGVIREFDIYGSYTPTVVYPRSLEIDPDTNPALVRTMRAGMTGFTIAVDGTLLLNGAAVVVNPEGGLRQDERAWRLLQNKLEAGQTLTNAEAMFYLKVVGRFMIAAYRYIQAQASGAGQ